MIAQGSEVSYEDQTLLDNLEYALRVGGPATSRFLGELGNISGLSVSRASSPFTSAMPTFRRI